MFLEFKKKIKDQDLRSELEGLDLKRIKALIRKNPERFVVDGKIVSDLLPYCSKLGEEILLTLFKMLSPAQVLELYSNAVEDSSDEGLEFLGLLLQATVEPLFQLNEAGESLLNLLILGEKWAMIELIMTESFEDEEKRVEFFKRLLPDGETLFIKLLQILIAKGEFEVALRLLELIPANYKLEFLSMITLLNETVFMLMFEGIVAARLDLLGHFFSLIPDAIKESFMNLQTSNGESVFTILERLDQLQLLFPD